MLRQACQSDRRGPATKLRSRALRGCWRALLLASCATTSALLAGCSSVSYSTVDTVRLAWQGSSQLAPTADQVQAKPYFQLHAITARGNAVLILGNVVGSRQYWYGADGVALVLEHGRVVQTMGLPQNLDRSRIEPIADPFAHGLQTFATTIAYERIDDWSPGYRYGVPVHAELKPSGDTRIDILGSSHHVVLVTEVVSAQAARYRASNRYWVDPADGFVWMSEQQVMPGVRIKLVQLRPYRGDES
jgi:hypothetical protein